MEEIFVGFDIYKFVKMLCDKLLVCSPDMTDGEKTAYKLGIDSVLSLLDQTLNEAVVEKDCIDNLFLAVHIPNLDIMTEFATVEEVKEKYEELT